jgi:hypothetical protein
MKIEELKEQTGRNGVCLHQRLVENKHSVFINNKEYPEKFIQCYDCGQIIAHVSSPPPQPTPDIRIGALVTAVSEIKNQITNISNTLKNWSNKT